MEQLENNLGSVGWSLPSEAVAKLDAASEPQVPYPYDFITKLARE
jgi:aryl-alcohol dehydrogenase-like predicted oxidoreductase